MVDYYSNFIEVDRINKVTTSGVTRVMHIMFSRCDVPDCVITDNGLQFASSEFATFAQHWGFEHVTSSPIYPQSNGKAKNAVKTVKMLFSKCQDSGQSEYRHCWIGEILLLREWRLAQHVFLEDAVEHFYLV